MRRNVVRRPAVRRDVLGIYLYLGQRSEQAAEMFLDEVEAAVATAADMPGIGAILADDPRFAGLRHIGLEHFPQVRVVYHWTDGDDEIEVRRVIHAARDLMRVLGEEGV